MRTAHSLITVWFTVQRSPESPDRPPPRQRPPQTETPLVIWPAVHNLPTTSFAGGKNHITTIEFLCTKLTSIRLRRPIYSVSLYSLKRYPVYNSKKRTTDVHFVNNIFNVAFTQFGRGTICSRKHTDHSKTKGFSRKHSNQ